MKHGRLMVEFTEPKLTAMAKNRTPDTILCDSNGSSVVKLITAPSPFAWFR